MNEDVQIQAVAFGEEAVEITYLEKRDITDIGILGKTAVIYINEAVATEAAELRSAAEDLLDVWLTQRRNPAPSYKGRPRP